MNLRQVHVALDKSLNRSSARQPSIIM